MTGGRKNEELSHPGDLLLKVHGGRLESHVGGWDSVGALWPHRRVDGTEMIVWGGVGPTLVNTGGRYDPSSDTWMPTSTGANVPTPRRGQTAVWKGTEMIVWGGDNRTGI